MASIESRSKQNRQYIKIYLSNKYKFNIFLSECWRLFVTQKPLLCNLRPKCHVNSKKERRMLTKLII